VEVTLSDLAAVANVVRKVEHSPLSAVGRMGGLAPDEQRAVPPWAWWGAATLVLVGGAVYAAKRARRGRSR
jgi:hypothetical protein